MRVSRIEERVTQAREAGFDPGRVSSMSRNLAGGGRLSWKLTRLNHLAMDWFPSSSIGFVAASGDQRFKRLQPAEIAWRAPGPIFAPTPAPSLGVTLQISEAPSVALVATIRSPKGVEELG